MPRITHELTETEIACGVTVEQVLDLLPKGLFFDGDAAFALPADTPPALGLSTARAAFGTTAEYAGVNQLGLPVYRRSEETS